MANEIRSRALDWHYANRERSLASKRAYYQANKEKWQGKKPNYRDPLYHRRWWLYKTYGVTLEEYDALLEAQQGLCAICLHPETKVSKKTGGIQNMPVDHCHETGKVRGLLCDRCNRLLGGANDDPAVLRAAAEYLERHRGE